MRVVGKLETVFDLRFPWNTSKFTRKTSVDPASPTWLIPRQADDSQEETEWGDLSL
jgi:hypothetical protein